MHATQHKKHVDSIVSLKITYIGIQSLLQVPEDPMLQPAIWLYQTATTESVGGAFGERVHFHSSPVFMVFQESTQR